MDVTVVLSVGTTSAQLTGHTWKQDVSTATVFIRGLRSHAMMLSGRQLDRALGKAVRQQNPALALGGVDESGKLQRYDVQLNKLRFKWGTGSGPGAFELRFEAPRGPGGALASPDGGQLRATLSSAVAMFSVRGVDCASLGTTIQQTDACSVNPQELLPPSNSVLVHTSPSLKVRAGLGGRWRERTFEGGQLRAWAPCRPLVLALVCGNPTSRSRLLLLPTPRRRWSAPR